jgi:hypothetical protein
MTDDQRAPNRRGQRAAGLHLRQLLLRPGPYRDRWERLARDAGPDEIRQDAVGQVVAEHLQETGERGETDTNLARTLKDRVSRALGGRGLSLETLRWFEAAFVLSRNDQQRIRELYRGVLHPTVISGSLTPPLTTKKPGHETTLLFEHHFLGPDGVPDRHHTQQTVRSLTDGLESYQYLIDTPEAEIIVNRGGRRSDVYRLTKELWAVDIQFHQPLRYGEEAYFDCLTVFHYSRPPSTEFRRATHRRVEHLDMRIEFHPDRQPRRLWWAQWADYREPAEAIVEQDELTLDPERSAHRYLEAIEHTVVGFYWDW